MCTYIRTYIHAYAYKNVCLQVIMQCVTLSTLYVAIFSIILELPLHKGYDAKAIGLALVRVCRVYRVVHAGGRGSSADGAYSPHKHILCACLCLTYCTYIQVHIHTHIHTLHTLQCIDVLTCVTDATWNWHCDWLSRVGVCDASFLLPFWKRRTTIGDNLRQLVHESLLYAVREMHA